MQSLSTRKIYEQLPDNEKWEYVNENGCGQVITPTDREHWHEMKINTEEKRTTAEYQNQPSEVIFVDFKSRTILNRITVPKKGL